MCIIFSPRTKESLIINAGRHFPLSESTRWITFFLNQTLLHDHPWDPSKDPPRCKVELQRWGRTGKDTRKHICQHSSILYHCPVTVKSNNWHLYCCLIGYWHIANTNAREKVGGKTDFFTFMPSVWYLSQVVISRATGLIGFSRTFHFYPWGFFSSECMISNNMFAL